MTIAVGTAAGIGLFIAVAVAGVGIKNAAHRAAEERVRAPFKAKVNRAIETYEKLLAMNPEDPNFQKVVETFEEQNDAAPAGTDAEQAIHSDLTDLWVHQRLRPNPSERYCKPGKIKEKDKTWCSNIAEDYKRDAELDSMQLQTVKVMTGFHQGGR